MNPSDDELRQAVALFRYGVIAELVHLPLGTRGMAAKLRDKAGQTYAIPGSTRTRVGVNTLRDWIRLYRDGGFEGLYPKARADRGKPRRLPPAVAERLIALKLDSPTWSVRTITRALLDDGIDHPLAPSTVYRLFSREGLHDRKAPQGADRRRFAFREAGELWMSDVMHGPKVRHGRTRRKGYLIAFIDDATRVIPFAAFAGAENIQAFLPVFRMPSSAAASPSDSTSTTAPTTAPDSSPWSAPSSASRSSTPGPIIPRERARSSAGSEPFARAGSPKSTPKRSTASRR